MTSLQRLEIGFALLLVVTVATKLIAARSQDHVDRTLFGTSAAAMLQQAGFETRFSDRPGGRVVEAERSACRVLLREYRPDGTFAVAIAEQARAFGPLRYAYRGALLPEPPKLRPLAEYYVRRSLQRFGLEIDRAPIVAIASSSGCDKAGIDWEQLATLPR